MICVGLLSVKKSDLFLVHASPAAAARIGRLSDKSVRRISEAEHLLLREGIDMQVSHNRTLLILSHAHGITLFDIFESLECACG
jgi:hypothetical protein